MRWGWLLAGGPDLAVFCLAAIDLDGIDVSTDSDIVEALALFVTGPVSIGGSIEVDGAQGILGNAGSGGPGGSDGADGADDADGSPGFGACAGGGGGSGHIRINAPGEPVCGTVNPTGACTTGAGLAVSPQILR